MKITLPIALLFAVLTTSVQAADLLVAMSSGGIISRDCSFLQTAILTKDPACKLFDEAKQIVPVVPGENAMHTHHGAGNRRTR